MYCPSNTCTALATHVLLLFILLPFLLLLLLPFLLLLLLLPFLLLLLLLFLLLLFLLLSDDEVEIWLGEACVPLSVVISHQEFQETCDKRVTMPIEPKVTNY